MTDRSLPAYADLLSDGVAIVTETGSFCAVNDVLALMLNYESKDHLMTELGTRPVFHAEADLDALRQVTRTGEAMPSRVCTLINRRGEACTASVSAVKRTDGLIDAVFAADRLTAASEIASLRSLLRRTQFHMAQTERTKTVGSLSGHLAHELNNVFGSVIGRAQLMQMRTTDERLLRECAYIVQAAEQGVTEVKRLLHFIHKSRQQLFGPMSVHEVFEEACALLEPTFEQLRAQHIPISIERNFECHPKIFGYVSELREIIVHLMRNAIDAMPDGGLITVSCIYGASDLSLTISDTGMGIDPDTQSKIFDPMFTTRDARHAGMGLTVTKELLRKMKGSVSFTSEPGQGASFSITLPKNEVMPSDAPAHAQVKQSELDQPPFISKIMIVDDDESVLISLEKLLSSKGFIIKALLDGRDAVRTARAFQPDVVITDLAMPDMNGWELAKEIRQMCPASKIIMTTAFTGMLTEVEMKQTSVDAIMQKPVNIHELINTIMSM
ncbi:MAG TPA: ATP-binding protein [Bacteroidota bacterium]|nr:ATP-binding protein [Bacteroidota bacterium]